MIIILFGFGSGYHPFTTNEPRMAKNERDSIVACLRARLEGLPVRINSPSDDMVYIYTHADLFTNLEQYTTTNRWDHICLKINGTQFNLRTVTVAYYINNSTFNESAVVCHLFLKCMDRLGLSFPPIENWAYISKRYVDDQPMSEDEVQKISIEYIKFLKVCKRNYEWRSCSRWALHWRAETLRRRKVVQRRVWDHWLELALRPTTGSLFKLYERHFSTIMRSEICF